MAIRIKRVYDSSSAEDGVRLLVDRIWPRGVSREAADLDDWLKDLAPSSELRKWFAHDENKWGEFRERYLGELKKHREEAREIAETAKKKTVTLLFATKDEKHNNAVVLQQYLEMFDVDRQVT